MSKKIAISLYVLVMTHVLHTCTTHDPLDMFASFETTGSSHIDTIEYGNKCDIDMCDFENVSDPQPISYTWKEKLHIAYVISMHKLRDTYTYCTKLAAQHYYHMQDYMYSIHKALF